MLCLLQSHVHFKPMVSVTSNCSTLPNKGPSSASPFTSSKQLPSMKNETKSPLTLPKKRMDNAHIPSNITQPALESREQISPAFKPRESFDKGIHSAHSSFVFYLCHDSGGFPIPEGTQFTSFPYITYC